MKLRELVLGHKYGKDEAILIKNFDTYFYDYDLNSEKLLREVNF